MKCPSCDKPVSDDAAVCPHCEAVLDPSLLDAAPSIPDDAPAPRPRPVQRPGGRPPTRPGVKAVKKPGRRPTTGGRPAVKPAARPSRMPDAPGRQRPQEKVDWRQQVDQSDWDAMPQHERAAFVADKGLDPDAVFKSAQGFFGHLTSVEKLTFFGIIGMLLSTFFPWKETQTSGDVLGLLSLGVVVTILSALSLAAMVLRVQESPSLKPLTAWAVQLGANGFSVLWCLVYIKLSWDSTLVRAPIGNADMWASKPSFGVIFCFIAGAVATLGTVAGLKDAGGR